MPTYEYECRDCGIRFERTQRITEAPLSTCDVCDGSVFRVIQPVGIAFRGSGFHINDYSKNGNGSCRMNGKAKGSDKSDVESKCEALCDKACPAKAD